MTELNIPRVRLVNPNASPPPPQGRPVEIQVGQTIINLHPADAFVLFKALRRLYNDGDI